MCLVDNLLSRLSRPNVHVASLSSGLGALGTARRAREVIMKAQLEMWRSQDRRKACPNEFSASVFEALEVSGTPRGEQESFKEAPKSSKLMIYQACGVLRSCQAAADSPPKSPEELLESQN